MLGSLTGSMLNRELLSGTRNQGYHSRVRVLMFPVGGAPFDIMVFVDGSGNRLVNDPCVAISAYTESISVGAFFPDYPLQTMR